MDFMINMKKLQDKWVKPVVRYTKVEFDNKKFRRFEYILKDKTSSVLWLDSNRSFIPEFLELKLEKEFEKVG